MGRLTNTSSGDGRVAPSTTSKKDLGVTPLVTAEREQDSFFCRDAFFAHASPLFLSGASGSFSKFLIIAFSLIYFFYFSIPYRSIR